MARMRAASRAQKSGKTGLKVGRAITNGVFRMNISGMTELQKKLEDFHREGVDLNEEVAEAVTEGLEGVKEASNILCPIDTGALRASAFVAVGKSANGRLKATVGYTEPYAKHVHENPDARHAPGTSFKFLEIAFIQLRPELEQSIKAATTRAIHRAAVQ